MINKIWKIIVFLLILLMPASALAIDNGEMAIYPANWDGQNELTKYWYIYNLDKGDSINDQVVVENTGNTDLVVKIYPVDALTTSDGAFALENEDEEKNDVGAWVKLNESEVNLSAGEKKTVDFTFSVPEDTFPGEHMGGIVIENKQIVEGEIINLKTRVGVRIYQTVPGEVIKKVDIKNIGVTGQYSGLSDLFYDYKTKFTLLNEGNVQLAPNIELSVDSPWFGNIYSISKKMENGTIFPNREVVLENNIDGTLYCGPYNVTITAKIDDLVPIQKIYTFWVIPWKIILLIALVIVALLSWYFMAGSNNPEKEKEEDTDFWGEKKKKKNTRVKKTKKNTKKTTKRKK